MTNICCRHRQKDNLKTWQEASRLSLFLLGEIAGHYKRLPLTKSLWPLWVFARYRTRWSSFRWECSESFSLEVSNASLVTTPADFPGFPCTHFESSYVRRCRWGFWASTILNLNWRRKLKDDETNRHWFVFALTNVGQNSSQFSDLCVLTFGLKRELVECCL